jgi:hypothetical protein
MIEIDQAYKDLFNEYGGKSLKLTFLKKNIMLYTRLKHCILQRIYILLKCLRTLWIFP